MIPQSVVDAIGTTINFLRSTVGDAAALIEAYTIAKATGPARGVYSRFIGALNKAGASLTTGLARDVYAAAKYWTNPGNALSELRQDVPIDPRLARDLPASGAFAAGFGAYRAMVEFTIEDPDTGKSVVKGVWVTSPYQPTLEEIYGDAEHVLGTILSGSPVIPGKSDVSDYNITVRITDFGRFV